ncbi:MAG: class I SAM-dependent methyltransferase [Pirellulales bacterium]|nr:class I SAM-dependent methyltransferase [Pirellulales bacterium]
MSSTMTMSATEIGPDETMEQFVARLQRTVRDQAARLEGRAQRIKDLTIELGRKDTEVEVRQLTNTLEKVLARHCFAIPLPPEELRLHVGTKATASNFWAQGLSSSTRVMEIFGEQPQGPILDWGCGCGRTLRWLLGNEAWRQNYRGCDVDTQAIEWLREHVPCPVSVCHDNPPLPYPDATFDGLFAFSVLTHIPPENHRAWYEEIRRVLRPGGLALLTVQGSNVLGEPNRYRVPTDVLDELVRTGQAYVRHEGHYKDAALVNEQFTRQQLDGLLQLEEYAVAGYQNMDQFLVRRTS